MVLPEVRGGPYRRLLLSALSPLDPSCIYILIESMGFRPSLSFYLWISGSNQGWCRCFVDRDDYSFFRDGVFSNGCFYLLTNCYNVHNNTYNYNIGVLDAAYASSAVKGKEVVNLTLTLPLHKVEIPEPEPVLPLGEGGVQLKYLMESCGEILLVLRYSKRHEGNEETYAIKVYRLDSCRMVLEIVEGLGDRTLFVGGNCCTSSTAKELGVEMANCICFTNDYSTWTSEWEMWDIRDMVPGYIDWGILCLDKPDYSNLSYLPKNKHRRCSPFGCWHPYGGTATDLTSLLDSSFSNMPDYSNFFSPICRMLAPLLMLSNMPWQFFFLLVFYASSHGLVYLICRGKQRPDAYEDEKERLINLKKHRKGEDHVSATWPAESV